MSLVGIGAIRLKRGGEVGSGEAVRSQSWLEQGTQEQRQGALTTTSRNPHPETRAAFSITL